MPAGLDGNPDPIVSAARSAVLETVANAIVEHQTQDVPLLVGIDGIDGSGKSTFADELAARVAQRGHRVVRSTIDSFHNPRAVRWQRGKASPLGFYADSHNFDLLRRVLLDPLQSGVGAQYQVAAFDEPTDTAVDPPWETVVGGEIVLFDGIFLQRPELRDRWDLVVFLDGQERVNLHRLSYILDGYPATEPDALAHVLEWGARFNRYVAGMQMYIEAVDPAAAASIVIDNNVLAKPVLTRI